MNIESLKLKIDNNNITDLSTVYTRSHRDLMSPKKEDIDIPELTLENFRNKSTTNELFFSYFFKKKSKSKVNLKAINNNKNKKDDYSLLMKKLEIWDKEHLSQTKEDPDILYSKLSNLYRKVNLKKELKKLEQFNNLLKSKSNFNKIMEKGAKTNKILEEFFNKRNKDQGSILSNNISKTKTRFNFSLFNSKSQKEIEQNIGVDSKTLNAMNARDLNNEYYNKVIKDKMKYENQLHDELISVNNEIYDKKIEKKETTEKLNNIYIHKTQLTKDFNKLFNRRKSILEKFQEDYEREHNNNNKKKKKEIYGKGTKINNFLKSMKASQKNEELKNNIKSTKEQYIENMKTIDTEREICINDIKRIEQEMNYYKQINDELIKEHRQYYMEILKNGYDSRGEGMIWVVRNLLELQTNLEYHHFPKFLTHEQADYLLKIATISLEEIQFKIILKVLKKKQNELKFKENIRRISIVEEFNINKYSKKNKEHDEIYDIFQNHKKVLTRYEKQKMKIKNEINKKFRSLYTRNEETMRMFGDKNEIDKDEEFIENLRDCLFGRKSLNDPNSLLKIFEGDKKQQKILSIILYIRQRLVDLNFIKKKMIEEQINIFKESQKFDEINLDMKQLMQKELVKKCLFGSNTPF